MLTVGEKVTSFVFLQSMRRHGIGFPVGWSWLGLFNLCCCIIICGGGDWGLHTAIPGATITVVEVPRGICKICAYS